LNPKPESNDLASEYEKHRLQPLLSSCVLRQLPSSIQICPTYRHHYLAAYRCYEATTTLKALKQTTILKPGSSRIVGIWLARVTLLLVQVLMLANWPSFSGFFETALDVPVEGLVSLITTSGAMLLAVWYALRTAATAPVYLRRNVVALFVGHPLVEIFRILPIPGLCAVGLVLAVRHSPDTTGKDIPPESASPELLLSFLACLIVAFISFLAAEAMRSLSSAVDRAALPTSRFLDWLMKGH
jgi:hypothetical protein